MSASPGFPRHWGSPPPVPWPLLDWHVFYALLVTNGLMGVNVDKVNKQVYALYTGITAATGVFVGLLFNINAQMGGQYTVFAFFVVVLAGLGYLPGVFAAALILGLVQAFFSVYFNPSYKDSD